MNWLGGLLKPVANNVKWLVIGLVLATAVTAYAAYTKFTPVLIVSELGTAAVTSTGHVQVDLMTLLACEDQAEGGSTGLCRVAGAKVRSETLMTGVTTNTTSAVTTLSSGGKTPLAEVNGTGALTATLQLYGAIDNAAANGTLLCTITLTGASTKIVAGCDSEPKQITQDWPYYYAVSTSVTGTGATVEFIVANGIAGGSNGLVSSVEAAGALLTSSQLIDDDQTGGTMIHRISAGATEDEHEVKATAGRLFAITATNVNAAVRYLRCAQLTAANAAPGSSAVWFGMAIPGATTGAGFTVSFGPAGVAFTPALTCWFVTGQAESDVAEVAANELNANYVIK